MMKAILWDMDGTLVNSEPVWETATYELAERLGAPLTPAARARTVGGSFHNTFLICADNAGVTPTPEREAEEFDIMVARMNELFAGGLEFMPGVPELLTQLRDAGVPMMIVTNTVREIADGCFDSIGRDFFTGTLTSSDVEHPKPAPDLYLMAARTLGVAPEECLVFEDSAGGMQAATAAGCRVVALPELPGTPVPPTARLLADMPGRNGQRSFEGLTLADMQAFFEAIPPHDPAAQ
ncbi:hypothetical protein C1Y63_03080 [Corynebacterium sp. 13CS0277]|uniref:HAD family hydrolase n=1 Tax=Corynebacterium sp. 13CS0277 TaxID=2071994 RepID=UPI000D042D49|nr:HAD family phosphatase [Corynebacterium sp. 13CS0277]PRQ12066.1 hypothetical protein C1Y63_03080 [Corynebacterium sp. 13CS0277]